MEINLANVDLSVCRTCLKHLPNLSAAFSLDSTISGSDPSTLQQRLKSCLPEIDLTVTISSVLCGECVAAVEFSYKFRKKCLETEEQVAKYNLLMKQTMRQNVTSSNLKNVNDACEEVIDLDPETNSDNDQVLELNSVQPHLQIVDIASVEFNTDAVIDESEEGYETIVADKILSDFTKCVAASGVRKIYKCNRCPFSTTYRYIVVSHMTAHLKKKYYKCDPCNFSTLHKSKLKKHNYQMHSIACDECTFSTASKSHFTIHKRKHKDGEIVPCVKRKLLKSNKNLILFKRVKTKSLYECKTCKLTFAKEDSLLLHEKEHVQELPDVICLD